MRRAFRRLMLWDACKVQHPPIALFLADGNKRLSVHERINLRSWSLIGIKGTKIPSFLKNKWYLTQQSDRIGNEHRKHPPIELTISRLCEVTDPIMVWVMPRWFAVDENGDLLIRMDAIIHNEPINEDMICVRYAGFGHIAVDLRSKILIVTNYSLSSSQEHLGAVPTREVLKTTSIKHPEFLRLILHQIAYLQP